MQFNACLPCAVPPRRKRADCSGLSATAKGAGIPSCWVDSCCRLKARSEAAGARPGSLLREPASRPSLRGWNCPETQRWR